MMDWHSFLQVNLLPRRSLRGPLTSPALSAAIMPVLQSGSSFTRERMDKVAPGDERAPRVTFNARLTRSLTWRSKFALDQRDRPTPPTPTSQRTGRAGQLRAGGPLSPISSCIRTVTWLDLGGGGSGGSVPRQQVHQQLSLPVPHWVEARVGVGEGAARTRYCPVSVPSPGPGTHAVLAFTPPQPFSRDKTNGQAGQIKDTIKESDSPVNPPGRFRFKD